MCAKEIYLNQRPEDQTKGYYCPSRSAGKQVLLIGTTGDGYNYYLRVTETGTFINELFDNPFKLSQEAQTSVFENNGGSTSKDRELKPITWQGRGGKLHYPTEEEFLQMVNVTIYFHYNMTMSEEKVIAHPLNSIYSFS